MLPSLSRVIPHGWLNWPSPLPAEPHFPTNFPSGVKTCRRLLPLWATMMLPFFSTGAHQLPVPLPVVRHFRRKLPLLSNAKMVFLQSSET